MKITQAEPVHAEDIARLVMQAMTDECCLNLSAPGHTIDHFYRMMCRLTAMEHSQYSYRNTLVALTDDGQVAGACVSYAGDDLHRLRRAFISAAKECIGADHTHMPDEAQPGELYIDSLAVYPQYRRRGIASALLKATIDKAHALGMPAGLLVDKGNPGAERLYTTLGFKYMEDTQWAGHPMKHLQK